MLHSLSKAVGGCRYHPLFHSTRAVVHVFAVLLPTAPIAAQPYAAHIWLDEQRA